MNAGTDLHACWTLNYVAVTVTTTAARMFSLLYPVEDCDSGIHCTTAQNGTLGECIIMIARWFGCQWLFQALFWGRDSPQDFFLPKWFSVKVYWIVVALGFTKNKTNKQKIVLAWNALIAMDSWGNHHHLFVAFYQALQNKAICCGRKIYVIIALCCAYPCIQWFPFNNFWDTACMCWLYKYSYGGERLSSDNFHYVCQLTPVLLGAPYIILGIWSANSLLFRKASNITTY